jgi:phenylacetate-CoA ligase
MEFFKKIYDDYSINGMTIQTLLNSKTFLKTYIFLRDSQYWPEEKIKKYQTDQLSKLITHAYENVPYYRKIFNKLKLKPEDIESKKDLKRLPFLTKDIIKKNLKDLKAQNYADYKFELSYSGGTTGITSDFYIEKGVWLANLMAYGAIMMNWVGTNSFQKGVQIEGREDFTWCYQQFGRVLVISSFHMSDDNIETYIKKIRKLRPRYIITYPSAITILGNYMKKRDIKEFRSLRAIICYGETMHNSQFNFLKDVFKCNIQGQYGLREQAAMAGTCPESNNYHVFPEYGIVELINKNGKHVKKEGEKGEIVGTGFLTHIFPFIRYRTGDIGIYTENKCSCGRHYPLLKNIEGRVQDYIVSKKGHLAPLTSVYHLIAFASNNVKECQLYQKKKGEVIINIIKEKNYSKSDSDRIMKNFKSRAGNDFDFNINFMDKIERTKRGKFRFLIQDLKIDIKDFK